MLVTQCLLINSFRARPHAHAVGHYTQMMWADSYLVGCAVIQYKELIQYNEWYTTLNVCNYGPTGNFNKGPVYATGTETEAASACPTETTPDTDTGLCV